MADDKGMYVSNRDYRLATSFGIAILFKKDTPVYVPPTARKAAMEVGILLVNKDETPFEEEAKADETIDPQGLERDQLIEEALREIKDRNDVDEFNAHGVPKVQKTEDILGFNVSAGEVKTLWMSVKAKDNG